MPKSPSPLPTRIAHRAAIVGGAAAATSMQLDEVARQRVAALEVGGQRAPVGGDAAQILGVGRAGRPLGDEIELAGIGERDEPARADGADVERAHVARDARERVVGEQLLGGAVGAAIVAEVVGGGDVEDERTLASIVGAQAHAARGAVAGGFVCLVGDVGVGGQRAHLDDAVAGAKPRRRARNLFIVGQRSHRRLVWADEQPPCRAPRRRDRVRARRTGSERARSVCDGDTVRRKACALFQRSPARAVGTVFA